MIAVWPQVESICFQGSYMTTMNSLQIDMRKMTKFHSLIILAKAQHFFLKYPTLWKQVVNSVTTNS